MPKKSSQNSTSEASTSVASVSSASVVAEEKKRQRKTTPAVQPVTPVAESAAESPAEPRTRQTPSRDSVEKEFDELVASIDEEITKLRENASKSKGVKFLRTVNKRVKALKNHALRISRQKQTTRRNNTNSGFLKPVQISKSLADFTGWDKNVPRSRVDVTKFICNYIKDKNLQDPSDKRQIRVNDDQPLRKLLNYDSTKEKKPLTYYSLQTFLKSHFLPNEAPSAPATVPAPVQNKPTAKKAVATA